MNRKGVLILIAVKKNRLIWRWLRMASLGIVLAVLATAARDVQAATSTTAGSANWNSTTVNAPWPSGTVPNTTVDVVIRPGDTVTVTASTTINSITFANTAASTGTVSVNSGLAAGCRNSV